MILFYSEFCPHCNVLIDTIKRHDKNNLIKMVSIDLLRSLKKPIDPKIHSVPALLILSPREYMFGKACFDYLIMPNRGVLFSNTLTRDVKEVKDINDSSTVLPALNNVPTDENEPSAFSLGAISSEYFSSIDDNETSTSTTLNDKNYNWDTIENANIEVTIPVQSDTESTSGKKLPSMEDIMKRRNADILMV